MWRQRARSGGMRQDEREKKIVPCPGDTGTGDAAGLVRRGLAFSQIPARKAGTGTPERDDVAADGYRRYAADASAGPVRIAIHNAPWTRCPRQVVAPVLRGGVNGV